jgi:N utilization substance protein B
MRFVDNFLLEKLAEDAALKAELESHKIQYWEQDGEYVELIYQDLIKSDLYESFMSSCESSLENDVTFVVEIFREIIVSNNKLYDYFQDKNITWVDDFPVVNTFIVKLFKRLTSKLKTDFFTPNLFKDKEDETFGFKLMKATRDNYEAYNAEIISKTKNWDKDRIAKIDFVLLQMAICEFQEFPSIPTKVTINEYIELAKEYSTPKSNVFINGVLDKIVKDYRNQKTLNKKGRGLM